MYIISLLNDIYECKHEIYIFIDFEYQNDTKDNHIYSKFNLTCNISINIYIYIVRLKFSIKQLEITRKKTMPIMNNITR